MVIVAVTVMATVTIMVTVAVMAMVRVRVKGRCSTGKEERGLRWCVGLEHEPVLALH